MWPHDHILANEMQTDMEQRMAMGEFQEGSLKGVEPAEQCPLLLFPPSPFLPCVPLNRSRGQEGPKAGEGQIMKDLKHQAKEFDIYPLLVSYTNDTCHSI